MYDPELYREKSEVEHWKERDPIAITAARLRARGVLDDDELATLEASVAAEIDEAVTFADAGSLEPVADLLRHVYAEVTP
jgi:pyruvate dehydrogenase E1 component alpha subunit